jgi:tetratricopeptide (TPR) repeat protein
MLKWFSARRPSGRTDAAVPDALPPADPAGSLGGIDHLLARARETPSLPADTKAEHFNDLMPVPRLQVDVPPPVVVVEEAVQAAAPVVQAPEPVVEPPPPPGPAIVYTVPRVTWETLHALAQMGIDQKEYAVAADWWWLMRLAFPEMMQGFVNGASALGEAGRFDDARQLLNEAEFRFPEIPAVTIARARLETRAGADQEAERYWQKTLSLPAPPWWVFTELATALTRVGRLDEADAVLAQGCRQEDGKNIQVDLQAMGLALNRRDWPLLVQRFTAVGDRFSDGELLDVSFDDLLGPLRVAEPKWFATAMEAPWIDRVTGSEQTDHFRLVNQSRLAQLAGNPAKALGRLVVALRNMPPRVEVYLRAETIMREAEQWPANGALLDEANRRFPMNEDVWIRIGTMKEVRGDWAGAVAFWTEMIATFPPAQQPGWRLALAREKLAEVGTG